jgi:hypothetical protein
MGNKLRVQLSDDMHPPGEAILRLTVQGDGDVIVAIDGKDSCTGKYAGVSVEFCQPGRGGGRKPKTHAALLLLAQAMNEEQHA